MSMSKSSKMLQFINYRMRVTIQDGRHLVGKFIAFDCHMNLLLVDCKEFHKLPPAKGKKNFNTNDEREDRRTLGLVLLHGEEVIFMTVESLPPLEDSCSKAASANAVPIPSIGCATGCGIPIKPLVQAQPGLIGLVRGVRGLAPGMMQPQISRPPIPQLSALPMTYPASGGALVVIRPPRQMPHGSYSGLPQAPQMPRGLPPTFGVRPPQQFPRPLPQFGQRPMVPPPGPMMRGPPFPPPPRLGMLASPPQRPGMPPSPGAVLIFGPPRPGTPPPPNPQNQQQN
ncbi:hypothetical protein CRYUN_Cryun34aG0112000 [Craigia yunnanensis]